MSDHVYCAGGLAVLFVRNGMRGATTALVLHDCMTVVVAITTTAVMFSATCGADVMKLGVTATAVASAYGFT